MIRDLDGKKPQIASSAFISEAAYIVGDVTVGEHASIWPGAVIRADSGKKIIIGNNTSIEDNCTVHSGVDMIIGDDTIIGHGVVVHCKKIGSHVMIGSGSIVLDRSEIGDFSFIAAGSLVPPDSTIPDRSFVMGVPARIKGEVSREQIAYCDRSVSIYRERGKKYKNNGL
jgi:carbonic anhydrase/acetyltransferase-like protein (isoleucine patch superfamily)